MIIKINKENKVIYKASGKAFENVKADNVKTFIVDCAPPVSESEELYFNPERLEFYTEEKPISTNPSRERIIAVREAKKNRKDALQWLADNDWKVNKRVLGEWTEDDERWKAYLDDRAKVRAKFDEAEAILKQK